MQCLDDRAVQAWMRGTVPEVERETVRAHLDTCDSCRDLLATSVDTQWIGQVVGRYRIVELIGGGAMGEVYRAEDPDLGRDVAIKVVRQGGSQKRLLLEAQAMAKLTHANVTRVYDVGTIADGVFLAMELVQGRTLRAWFAEEPRTWREVVALMRQAAAGVHAAHEAGLVHGDFKPDNVLVAHARPGEPGRAAAPKGAAEVIDGRVLVTDFGLARMVFAEPHTRATDGALDATCGFAGTPAYMAPEQFDEAPVATPASDQFSFCVTLFEGLYGKRPYAGADLATLRDAVVAGKLEMPAQRVPGRLVRLLRRGLATRPAERFASMAALGDELDATVSRRALWIGGGVATVGAAVAATLLVTGAGRDAACEDGASRFAGVWDKAARDRIAKAFESSTVPYASTSLAGLTSALDRYRDRWVATYTETCKATHVRKEQSAALLDTRMLCLDRRKAESKAVLDELSTGTPAAVRDAVTAANALRPVADCNAVASLQDLERLPADAAQRSRITAADGAVAKCRALFATGQYRPGQTCAGAAAKQAAEVGYGPTIAEAELVTGQFALAMRTWPEASAAITKALLAAEESRDARTRAKALIALIAVDAERGKFAQSHEHAKHASAVIKGLGGGADLTADLTYQEGALLLRESKFAESAEALERAVTLREEAYGKQDARVAEPFGVLGSLNTVRKQYDAAQQAYDRALAIQQAALGATHPAVAKTLHGLAQLQLRTGKTEDALATQKRSYDMLVAAYGEEHRDVALSANVVMQALMFSGKYAEAAVAAARAVELMEKAVGPDHPDTAIALQGLAAAYSRADKNDEAGDPPARARDPDEDDRSRASAHDPDPGESGDGAAHQAPLHRGAAATRSCARDAHQAVRCRASGCRARTSHARRLLRRSWSGQRGDRAARTGAAARRVEAAEEQ